MQHLFKSWAVNGSKFIFVLWISSSKGTFKSVVLTFQDIAETYGNKSTVNQNGIRKEIRFIKADIDDCGEAGEAFEINALPAAIIIIDQKIISTHFGLGVAKIREDIEMWLQSFSDEDGSTATLMDLTSINEKQKWSFKLWKHQSM